MLAAAGDFVDRVFDPFVEVDVFDAGEAKDGDEDVAEFLFVGFVFLSGDVGGFAAVFGQIGAGHFADFFDEGEDEKRTEFLLVFEVSVDIV